MTDESRLEALLKQLVDIQTGILQVVAESHVAAEKTKAAKAVKLRRDFDFPAELLTMITGVRSDNLRRTLEREGLL